MRSLRGIIGLCVITANILVWVLYGYGKYAIGLRNVHSSVRWVNGLGAGVYGGVRGSTGYEK